MFFQSVVVGAVALSLVLQVAVVELEVLNEAFGTTALSLRDWLVCGALPSNVF